MLNASTDELRARARKNRRGLGRHGARSQRRRRSRASRRRRIASIGHPLGYRGFGARDAAAAGVGRAPAGASAPGDRVHRARQAQTRFAHNFPAARRGRGERDPRRQLDGEQESRSLNPQKKNGRAHARCATFHPGHRRPRGPWQKRAGQSADRHRPRPAARGKSPRHHHRSGFCAPEAFRAAT